MNFAVIFTYSFDSETSVYLFRDEDDAKKFLKDCFAEEIRIDTEENGWTIESYIGDDGRYAKLSVYLDDGEVDITEMRIGNICR